MALILSIPKNVRAAQIDATQRIHKLYDGYYYDFVPDSSIPSGYEFNSDVLDYVISKGADFLNSWITQRYGNVINWLYNTLAQSVFSLCRNVAIAAGLIQANLFDSDQWIYKWEFECTGIEASNSQYGDKYGFLFTGLFGETFSIVLNANGNIWGSEYVGNITASETQQQIINQIAPQYDPNDINVPVVSYRAFSDMKAPYISGKSLHFFYYRNNTEHEVVINDFRNLNISYYPTYVGSQYIIFEFYSTDPSHFDINNITVTDNGNNLTLYPNNNKLVNLWRTNQENINSKGFSLSSISDPYFNLPGYYINQPYQTAVQKNNALGRDSSGIVLGFGDIYLSSYSITPTTRPANPDPVPIDVPIPVTEIPSNPEDPIPQSPIPDPVPGIPVNPIPPSLRPVPSIVSGNDDLWPSVVELQNIEIDLSGYLSGLGDYSFPDLSVITESFAGSILWVSALMSTLFNGSDFSILFAVLSSFFIVAALLGLYKWWNHK